MVIFGIKFASGFIDLSGLSPNICAPPDPTFSVWNSGWSGNYDVDQVGLKFTLITLLCLHEWRDYMYISSTHQALFFALLWYSLVKYFRLALNSGSSSLSLLRSGTTDMCYYTRLKWLLTKYSKFLGPFLFTSYYKLQGQPHHDCDSSCF